MNILLLTSYRNKSTDNCTYYVRTPGGRKSRVSFERYAILRATCEMIDSVREESSDYIRYTYSVKSKF